MDDGYQQWSPNFGTPACNYNPDATVDDGSCRYPDEHYDCYGNCLVELDCAGNCCVIGEEGCYWQETGPCGEEIPSDGMDECGVCGGDNTSCMTCAGVPCSDAYEDNCGICDDIPENDCVQDCAGTWGGNLVYDECGICGGPGYTSDCGCSDIQTGFCDCEGNELDECGICGGNSSTCEDCAGVSNGDAVEDNCGICDNDTSNDCIKDCAGIWGGTAGEDECGVCGGDGPEQNYNCEGNCVVEVDCAGICGGSQVPIFPCGNEDEVCNPADCNLDISSYLLPDEFGISKIFPNPFNPITQIQYELTQFGLISIKIYDIKGRVVDQLMNEYQSPGHYSLNWNAVNHASGMYIVEMLMQLENNEVSRDLQKILYLK